MKVGTPQTLWVLAASWCSTRTLSSAAPDSISLNTASASTPLASSTSRMLASSSWPCPGRGGGRTGRACTARNCSGNLSRTTVPARRARSPLSSCRVDPRCRARPRHVHLSEGERHEPDVPVGTALQAGDHVLVDVAGEGAAIVPGHGEVSHRAWPTGLAPEVPFPGRIVVMPPIAGAMAGWSAAIRDGPDPSGRRRRRPQPSAGADHHVGGVVHPGVDAAGGDDGRRDQVQRGQRVVARRRAGRRR